MTAGVAGGGTRNVFSGSFALSFPSAEAAEAGTDFERLFFFGEGPIDDELIVSPTELENWSSSLPGGAKVVVCVLGGLFRRRLRLGCSCSWSC